MTPHVHLYHKIIVEIEKYKEKLEWRKVSNEKIQITDLSIIDDFLKGSPKHLCKEICETDKICIPCKKPSMDYILDIFLKVSIHSFKIISTSIGKKLVINGTKHVKLIYKSNKTCEDALMEHFHIPFCTFILLGCHEECKIKDVKASVEYAIVRDCDGRCFNLSSIFSVDPVFNKCDEHENSTEKCECKPSKCKECKKKKCKKRDCKDKDKKEYLECNDDDDMDDWEFKVVKTLSKFIVIEGS